jgi:hypothetical protein
LKLFEPLEPELELRDELTLLPELEGRELLELERELPEL